MTDALSKLLQDRDWLLADGATGTNLFNMGLMSGDAPELWNVDEPEKIRALYRGAVEAGSDIFLTNSFGGTASRLKLHNAQDRVGELNRIAAELGREVADKAGRTVIEIERSGLGKNAEATRAALAAGMDVVFQGTFLSGNWGGWSDFPPAADSGL